MKKEGAAAAIDRYFGITEAGSSAGVEVRAGVTTFLTMAYILFVNPYILGKAIVIEGVDTFPQLLTATAVAAAAGSLMMGLVARYPYALAPGMGINAYFTFTVVLGRGIAWQAALGAVFISGVIFIVLSVAGLRTFIVNAIPAAIKSATAAGIGLFLAIIGAETSGLVVDHPATLVTLGDLGTAGPLITFAGLIVIGTLLALRVKGALLIGIVSASVLAMVSGAAVYAGGKPFGGFEHGIVRPPVWPSDLVGALDLAGAAELGLLGIVFVFVFVDLFDTAGTLLGLSDKAGFTDEQGHLPRASAAFTSDAVATSLGALLGTSSTTTYIESASGIEEGGRTGLTAVVTGALFLLSLFFWPLASAVPSVATAPALIVVGAMMMSSLKRINWDDYRQSIPVFLTIIAMPLTYSIANGISFGIIAWVLIHALSGRAREVSPLMYVMAVLLAARYAYLGG